MTRPSIAGCAARGAGGPKKHADYDSLQGNVNPIISLICVANLSRLPAKAQEVPHGMPGCLGRSAAMAEHQVAHSVSDPTDADRSTPDAQCLIDRLRDVLRR